MSQWTDPDWREDVHTWIHGVLAELGAEVTGPIEQPHIVPWSTVMRVPTGGCSIGPVTCAPRPARAS